MPECSLQIMSRNLTPIMLVAGPLMFMGAFFQWPITNEVGMEAVNLLDDRGLLMLAVGHPRHVSDVRRAPPPFHGHEEGC